MYACNDCGEEFETPNATEIEAGTGYNVDTCPACGSPNMDEIEEDDPGYDDYDDGDLGEFFGYDGDFDEEY